jgi:hypothetical protein
MEASMCWPPQEQEMGKVYVFIGSMLALLAFVGASFYFGMQYQKKKDEASNLQDFKATVYRALDITDKFLSIGKEFVEKINNTREVTKTVTQTQVKYVDRYIQEHPEVVNCVTVPAPVISMRNCQISRIRKAAGYSVSESGDGTLCSP